MGYTICINEYALGYFSSESANILLWAMVKILYENLMYLHEIHAEGFLLSVAIKFNNIKISRWTWYI